MDFEGRSIMKCMSWPRIIKSYYDYRIHMGRMRRYFKWCEAPRTFRCLDFFFQSIRCKIIHLNLKNNHYTPFITTSNPYYIDAIKNAEKPSSNSTQNVNNAEIMNRHSRPDAMARCLVGEARPDGDCAPYLPISTNDYHPFQAVQTLNEPFYPFMC